MAIIKLGFTGTRLGMSDVQKDVLYRILRQHEGFFHHGDCIGADEQAHDMARILGWSIHTHPPVVPRYRAWKRGDSESPTKDYLSRNRDIVNNTMYLIACPKSRQEMGGTWYTINYAKKNNRSFTIILPDGTMGQSVLEVGKERIIT